MITFLKRLIEVVLGSSTQPVSPSIVLLPIPRNVDTDWAGGRSWFGGQPILGGAAWPRHPDDDRPLHMVAQIDLTDLAACDLPFDMPKTGTLAFFADALLRELRDGGAPGAGIAGAVIYSEASDVAPTAPPEDLDVPYGNDWSFYFSTHRSRADVPVCFDRWPLEMIPVVLGQDTLEEDYFEQVGPRLNGGHLMKHPPLPPREEVSWRVVRTMIDNLARSVNGYRENAFRERAADDPMAEIYAKHRDVWPEIETFAVPLIARWDNRIAAATLDDPIGAEALADLDRDLTAFAHWKREHNPTLRSDFITEFFVNKDGEVPGLGNYYNFSDAMAATYHGMRNGSDEVFKAIPRAVRDFWQAPRQRGPYTSAHFSQILGPPVDIQDVCDAVGDRLMLLQLASEGPFLWGDVGYIKYWITRDELAAGEFGNVLVTFEGH